MGINLEDTDLSTGVLLPIGEQCHKIRLVAEEARTRGIHLFINARTDVLLRSDLPTGEQQLEEILKRGRACKSAGADCFYPVTLSAEVAIRTVVEELAMPVNILTVPGIPSLERLAPYGMRAEKPDYFVLPYGEDILEAMNLFLERDVPIFQALLEEHDLQETLGIPRKRFTHQPANPVFVQETAPEYKQSRLARLCRNTNGWVMPSERVGKSDAETAFESQSGFGLEEWLLDLDKLLNDGYTMDFYNRSTGSGRRIPEKSMLFGCTRLIIWKNSITGWGN